jgi:hypothetical protein
MVSIAASLATSEFNRLRMYRYVKEFGVEGYPMAYDCNLRWHLWPNNSATALLDKLRLTLRRHIN